MTLNQPPSSSLLFAVLALAACCSAKSPSPSSSFKPATFVPPASPLLVTGGPAPPSTIAARRDAVVTGYGTLQPLLFAKPKKKGAAGKKKIQVKLLKYIEGTGSPGDVIMVAPAFFENKLKRSGSAVKVSDEEVARERQERDAKADAAKSAAEELRSQIDGTEIEIKRRAGPEGSLFGGVGTKHMVEELRNRFRNEKGLEGKQVKILSVKDEEGEDPGHDIKHVGKYEATVSLLKDVSATFTLSVVGE